MASSASVRNTHAKAAPVDYPKIIIALLENFISAEGTDYLNHQREPEKFEGFTDEENAEVTRLRDVARKNLGWTGY
jgi:hypothetical protein